MNYFIAPINQRLTILSDSDTGINVLSNSGSGIYSFFRREEKRAIWIDDISIDRVRTPNNHK